MGLFSKKPGGTFFGNLLRKGAKVISSTVGGLTGGMVNLHLGEGGGKIEAGQTLTNDELLAAMNNGTYNNGMLSQPDDVPNGLAPPGSAIDKLFQDIRDTVSGAKSAAQGASQASKWLPYVVAGVSGFIIFLLVLLVNKKK